MVVSNTSPLVYFAALGDFQLLQILFEEITIPRAVFQEVVVAGASFPAAQLVQDALGTWISIEEVTNRLEADQLREGGLDSGESEVIVLAQELRADALLMDDSDGVRSAVAGGANVIRTPGIYRLAKEKRLIPEVGPKLDELRAAGYWLREEHYRMILRGVGE
jgi:hypothetical protein